jgi:hypothetical protein
MEKLTHTQVYMDHLEKLMSELHLDEETKKELMEKHIEEYKGLPGSPRPKKKRKINEEGDYVITKSLELLKRKRNKNRGQHQENTVVPSMLARNN